MHGKQTASGYTNPVDTRRNWQPVCCSAQAAALCTPGCAGSGSIDLQELRQVLRALGQFPTPVELAELMERVDANGNGVASDEPLPLDSASLPARGRAGLLHPGTAAGWQGALPPAIVSALGCRE